MIPKTTLGNTDLHISRLGYGAMELRDLEGEKSHPSSAVPGKLKDPKQAEQALNAALDAGISFIDTAWAYGRSEEFIGRFISHRREEYTLATKAGHLYRGVSDQSSWTVEAVTTCLEQSLKRLNTDHVDLLQLHNPRPEEVDWEAMTNALERFRSRGMLRYIGLSSGVPHIDKFLDLGIFDSIQVPYSALMPENARAIQRAKTMGVGVITRGTLGEGAPIAGDPSRALYKKLKSRWDNSCLPAMADNITEFLIRYSLTNPNVDVALFGSANPDHITANAASAEQSLLQGDVVEQVQSSVAELMK
ncbi:aldo/keto reductase [Hahella ganghwensis]|uniref:aldo/keto reductase n=1 Tax=Hahella ganghwensis TaxID=286420 RepID=UPI000378234D|nr:aldo/keto reductase [Hahella ganghwensis]